MRNYTASAVILLTVAVQAFQNQEFVRDENKQPRRLSWNLEDSLYRLGYLTQPMYHHRDSFAQYDHGLMQEH